MRVRFVVPSVALVCLLLPVQRAYADPPLAGFLVDLLYRSIVMKSTTNTLAGNPHEAHCCFTGWVVRNQQRCGLVDDWVVFVICHVAEIDSTSP